MAGDQAFSGVNLFRHVFAKHRLHAQRIDLLHVRFDLRLPFLRIFRRQLRRCGRPIDQRIIEKFMTRVLVKRADMIRGRQVQTLVGLRHQIADENLHGARFGDGL